MGTTSKNIRKRMGLTQKAFAEKYHINLRTLEGWDTKKRFPIYFEIALNELCDLLEGCDSFDEKGNKGLS